MAKHPAQFSSEIVAAMQQLLWDEMDEHNYQYTPLVVDPFAGIGKIEEVWPYTAGVELEWEWASQGDVMIQGDALNLPFASRSIEVIATSPVFGNRMSDHHEAKEKCQTCKGTGHSVRDGNKQWVVCPRCNGEGKREYDRITYRHKLGRMPSEGSSAILQWGEAYREFHVAAWRETHRVLVPGGLFVLNIGDHIRKHKRQRVASWHRKTILSLGFTEERRIKVRTRKMKKGANRDARVPYEWVLSYRKE